MDAETGGDAASQASLSAEQLCDLARPLIQAKARRLAGRAGITPSDQDDIEQEIYLRIVQRVRAGYPMECHPLAAIVCIVDQSIANQLRDRTAQKRDPGRVQKLHADADVDLGAQFSQLDLDVQRQRSTRDPTERADLGIDLAEVLDELTQDQRELCEALGIESFAELARRLKRPRTTLQDIVRKVRRQFEDAGLKAYVQ